MSLYATYFGAVSVKDPVYGAVGDGSTDDTAAFQAAINDAFGTVASPHGHSNPFANKILFIPPGKYKITSPLYLAGVLGGIVRGAGNGTTEIQWRPTNGAAIPGGGSYSGSGNALIADSQTPCFCTDGANALRFEDFDINGPSTTAASTVVGIYISMTGTYGQATNSTYTNMSFSSMGVGILAGGGNGNGCDDGTVINCQFSFCTLAGVRTSSQNALNWSIHGGGADNCAANSTFAPGSASVGNAGAAYSVAAGSISSINSVAVSLNTWDFVNAGAEGMAIIGGSSESLNSVGSSSAPISIQGMSFRMDNSLGCCWIDARMSGIITAGGCWFNPGNNNGFGNIAKLGNAGIVILDACVFGPQGDACGFTGTAGSKLYLRGNLVAGTYATLLTNFTGTVEQNI